MTSIYDLNRSCKTDEKDCCPPFPHYTMPITDQDFVERNIQMSNDDGVSFDPTEQLPRYVYPGNLALDESKTMAKCDYDEWLRQEDVARRGNLATKFWQDLNTGRRGMARGLSDGLDLTIEERNNFPSGWFNAKMQYGGTPGGTPWRDPYLENHVPIDPMKYRTPLVTNTSLGNRHYFYSIYDLDDVSGTGVTFCKCKRTPQVRLEMKNMDWKRGQEPPCRRCGKPQMKTFPERYV